MAVTDGSCAAQCNRKPQRPPLENMEAQNAMERLKRRTQIELKKNKHVFKQRKPMGSFYDALHDFKLTVLTMFYMISR